jgi:hypothetical protein
VVTDLFVDLTRAQRTELADEISRIDALLR